MKTSEAIPIIEEWLKKIDYTCYSYIEDPDVVRLIILTDDGLTYEHEAGGYACHNYLARGILINTLILIEDVLIDGSGWWEGDAKEFFEKNPSLEKYFEPNGKAEESWIPVIIKGCNLAAILIYENSD